MTEGRGRTLVRWRWHQGHRLKKLWLFIGTHLVSMTVRRGACICHCTKVQRNFCYRPVTTCFKGSDSIPGPSRSRAGSLTTGPKGTHESSLEFSLVVFVEERLIWGFQILISIHLKSGFIRNSLACLPR